MFIDPRFRRRGLEPTAMPSNDEFAMNVAATLFEAAEPRLREALAKHGVTHPKELPDELARELFRQCVLDTAVASFPTANLEALNHGARAFAHPAFSGAFTRVKAQVESKSDAFAMVAGIDAAIVLAGLGLEVAPFDRKSPRILASLSNDVDIVIDRFSRLKSAYVAYSPGTAPFYLLVTDCVRTLGQRINTRDEFRHIRELFERSGETVPQGDGAPFRHGFAIFAREPNDRIPTVFLNDPSPFAGSVVLYAGWTEDDAINGVPNDGFIPVPLQFLRGAVSDASIAFWIWHPVGARSYLQ